MPHRVAWIGCGNLTRYIHLPLVRAMHQFEIVAFYDPLIDRAISLQPSYPNARVFDDLNELLSCGSYDVVCIVVPPQHLADLVAAVSPYVNKGLFCEKPLGVSIEDAQKIRDCVPQHIVTFCAFNRRFWPAVGELKRLIQNFGPLQLLKISYHKHYLDREKWARPEDWILWTEMCHAIDLLIELGGPISSARFMGNSLTQSPYDVMMGQGLFRQSGMWGIDCNFASGNMKSVIEVHTVGLGATLLGATELRVGIDNKPDAFFPIGVGQSRTEVEGYAGEWREFARNLEQGAASSSSSFERAFATMRVCHLAEQELLSNTQSSQGGR